MRNLILHNWKVKLTCLALAAAIWYLIYENIPREPVWRTPPPNIWTPPPTLD